MEFFPVLLSRVPSETVIFGELIHVAQMSLLMSKDPGLCFGHIRLLPSLRAIVVT